MIFLSNSILNLSILTYSIYSTTKLHIRQKRKSQKPKIKPPLTTHELRFPYGSNGNATATAAMATYSAAQI